MLLLLIDMNLTNLQNTYYILTVHFQMLSIVRHRKYDFRRWLKEVELMLDKDPGTPPLHRLRITYLYEAW